MPPSLRFNLDQLTCAVAWTRHAQASAVLRLRSSPLVGDLSLTIHGAYTPGIMFPNSACRGAQLHRRLLGNIRLRWAVVELADGKHTAASPSWHFFLAVQVRERHFPIVAACHSTKWVRLPDRVSMRACAPTTSSTTCDRADYSPKCSLHQNQSRPGSRLPERFPIGTRRRH